MSGVPTRLRQALRIGCLAVLLNVGVFGAASGEAIEPVQFAITLQAEEASVAASALNAVEDHEIVLLDVLIELAPARPVQISDGEGGRRVLEGCGYGRVANAAEVDLPIADPHLVATVVVGDPTAHPANAAFCAYAPRDLSVTAEALHVRGCFLALSFSIPTARHLVFQPLGPEACGLTP